MLSRLAKDTTKGLLCAEGSPLEEGVWGRNLWKVSPPLARSQPHRHLLPQRTPHIPIQPMVAFRRQIPPASSNQRAAPGRSPAKPRCPAGGRSADEGQPDALTHAANGGHRGTYNSRRASVGTGSTMEAEEARNPRGNGQTGSEPGYPRTGGHPGSLPIADSGCRSAGPPPG